MQRTWHIPIPKEPILLNPVTPWLNPSELIITLLPVLNDWLENGNSISFLRGRPEMEIYLKCEKSQMTSKNSNSWWRTSCYSPIQKPSIDIHLVIFFLLNTYSNSNVHTKTKYKALFLIPKLFWNFVMSNMNLKWYFCLIWGEFPQRKQWEQSIPGEPFILFVFPGAEQKLSQKNEVTNWIQSVWFNCPSISVLSSKASRDMYFSGRLDTVPLMT